MDWSTYLWIVSLFMALSGAVLVGLAAYIYVNFQFEQQKLNLDEKKRAAHQLNLKEKAENELKNLLKVEKAIQKAIIAGPVFAVGLVCIICGMLLLTALEKKILPTDSDRPDQVNPLPVVHIKGTDKAIDSLEGIRRLLNERLTSPKDLQHGLKDIREAIDNLKEDLGKNTDSSSPPVKDNFVNFIWWCVILAAFGVLFPFVVRFALAEKYRWPLIGISTLISLGGLTFFGIDTVNLFNIGSEINGTEGRVPSETRINIERVAVEWPFDSPIATETSPPMRIMFEQLPSIRNFESGKESLKDCNALSELNDAIKNNLEKQYTLSFMIIAGKVDKRLLNETAQRKYGSNLGLAQKRAAWVKDCLVGNENLGLDREKLIAVATGPEQTGNEANHDLEKDRIVLVYAFWTKANRSNDDSRLKP